MRRIGWALNSIPIYIQQDATLHSLFISGNCSTSLGWYFHPSSGEHTTVSTSSGICHTVTAICRYRGRVGTDLSVLWVVYATHSTLYLQYLIVFTQVAAGWGERPGTYCTRGWVGPRAGLDRCGKSRPHRNSIPGPSNQLSVATLTELLGPRCKYIG
jgi:hypothetical protein